MTVTHLTDIGIVLFVRLPTSFLFYWMGPIWASWVQQEVAELLGKQSFSRVVLSSGCVFKSLGELKTMLIPGHHPQTKYITVSEQQASHWYIFEVPQVSCYTERLRASVLGISHLCFKEWPFLECQDVERYGFQADHVPFKIGNLNPGLSGAQCESLHLKNDSSLPVHRGFPALMSLDFYNRTVRSVDMGLISQNGKTRFLPNPV